MLKECFSSEFLQDVIKSFSCFTLLKTCTPKTNGHWILWLWFAICPFYKEEDSLLSTLYLKRSYIQITNLIFPWDAFKTLCLPPACSVSSILIHKSSYYKVKFASHMHLHYTYKFILRRDNSKIKNLLETKYSTSERHDTNSFQFNKCKLHVHVQMRNCVYQSMIETLLNYISYSLIQCLQN